VGTAPPLASAQPEHQPKLGKPAHPPVASPRNCFFWPPPQAIAFTMRSNDLANYNHWPRLGITNGFKTRTLLTLLTRRGP